MASYQVVKTIPRKALVHGVSIRKPAVVGMSSVTCDITFIFCQRTWTQTTWIKLCLIMIDLVTSSGKHGGKWIVFHHSPEVRLLRRLLTFCWCLGEKITLKRNSVYILWRKECEKLFTSVREQQEQGFSLRGGEPEIEGNHSGGWTMTLPTECSPITPEAGEQSRVVMKMCPINGLVTNRQDGVTGQVYLPIPHSSSGRGLGAGMAETAQPGTDSTRLSWNGVPKPKGVGWMPQVRLGRAINA